MKRLKENIKRFSDYPLNVLFIDPLTFAKKKQKFDFYHKAI